MKLKFQHGLTVLALFALSILNLQLSTASAQGRLNLNGSPVNGSYDIQFRLYDAATGLIVQQNTNGAPNMILGSPFNYASSGIIGATVSGGALNNGWATTGFSITNGFGTNFCTVTPPTGNLFFRLKQ